MYVIRKLQFSPKISLALKSIHKSNLRQNPTPKLKKIMKITHKKLLPKQQLTFFFRKKIMLIFSTPSIVLVFYKLNTLKL